MQFGNGAIMGGQYLMPHSTFGLGGFGIFAFVGFFIVAAIVVAVVIWAIARKPARNTAAAAPAVTGAAPAEDAALVIARERLARGDIEPDQYVAIVAALKG
jgi:uncharacterized membrane protein